jgi:hypothetical protein
MNLSITYPLETLLHLPHNIRHSIFKTKRSGNRFLAAAVGELEQLPAPGEEVGTSQLARAPFAHLRAYFAPPRYPDSVVLGPGSHTCFTSNTTWKFGLSLYALQDV